jgi:RNA polymerase-binding transcription factor DksA
MAKAGKTPKGDTNKKRTKSARKDSNKTPFTKKELGKFKELLLDRRNRILSNVTAMEQEALKAAGQDFSVDHMADHGSDNFEQDLTLSLVESERKELYEIDGALLRIEDSTYGICEGTGLVISRARLEAIPYTRYSIEYQRKIEAGEIDDEEDEDEE